MKLRFLSIFFLCFLGGCKWFSSAGTPYFKWTNFKVPNGTPAFQQGYKDGCSTVLYARGNVYYRTKYDYRYDPKMIGNPEYRFGHSRGYTWCFQQIIQGVSGAMTSFDRAINPYGYDTTFNAGNTEAAWDGFFGSGNSPLGASTNSGFDGIFDVMQKGVAGGVGGGGKSLFGTDPLWMGGSSGQFFGQ
jgi:hypothetical protein